MACDRGESEELWRYLNWRRRHSQRQLGYISARSMAVPPAANGDNCPFGEAPLPVWPRYLGYSEQVTVTAGAGRLLVGLTELRKHNWSRDFRIWRRLGPDGRLGAAGDVRRDDAQGHLVNSWPRSNEPFSWAIFPLPMLAAAVGTLRTSGGRTN